MISSGSPLSRLHDAKTQTYWHYAAWGYLAASTVCVKTCHQFVPQVPEQMVFLLFS